MPLFLKGYKLDMSKITQTFNVQPPESPDDWVIPTISTIPRWAYKYIGNGYEGDGELNVMIVMETGRDAKELMKNPVEISESKTLADVARRVCVPAIWPCWDSAFCPGSAPNEEMYRSRLPFENLGQLAGRYWSAGVE